VKGDALIVGVCASYDLDQLYNDFPNIKELIGQCHAGALQRTNGQDEMKRKRADVDEQDRIQQDKKLHTHKEAADDEEE
jgi:hypothetical protein